MKFTRSWPMKREFIYQTKQMWTTIILLTSCKEGKSKDCCRINVRSFMVIRLSISKYLKYQGLGCRTSLTLPKSIMTSIIFSLNTEPLDTRRDNGFGTLVWLFLLILVVATLAEEEFKEFVKSKIELQEAEFSKNRNTSFTVLLNFISLIKRTNVLSSKQSVIIFRIKWEISSISQ